MLYYARFLEVTHEFEKKIALKKVTEKKDFDRIQLKFTSLENKSG